MSIKSDISTDLIRVDMIVSRRQEQTIELVTIVAKKNILNKSYSLFYF